jgi:CRP-like cAMP-binding protein
MSADSQQLQSDTTKVLSNVGVHGQNTAVVGAGPIIPDLEANDPLQIKYGRQKYRPVVVADPRVGILSPLRRVDTAEARTTAAKYSRNAMFPEWMMQVDSFKSIFSTPMLPEDVGIRKDPADRTNVDHNAIAAWLKRHSLFVRFSNTRLKEVSKLVKLKEVHKQSKPFASNADTRNNLYIVHGGEVIVTSPILGFLGVLKKGDSIGYVEGTPATFAMATANSGEYNVELLSGLTGCSVVVIKRSEYKLRMMEFLEIEVFKNMKFFESEVELFKDWTLGRILVFARQCTEWNVSNGEFIVRQGEDMDNMFFVRAGKVAIQKQVKYKKTNVIPTPNGFVERDVMVNRSVEVCVCPPGDFFGHQSMLDGECSYISAVSVGNTQLLVARKEMCFAMFGFRGTMEKLRHHAKRFLNREDIVATLERNIERKLVYESAISHVPESAASRIHGEPQLLTFEKVMPQPLSHTVQGKDRKILDTMGKHFDMHKAVSSKKARLAEIERQRKVRIQSGELLDVNKNIFESMKRWGKKSKNAVKQKRRSIALSRRNSTIGAVPSSPIRNPRHMHKSKSQDDMGHHKNLAPLSVHDTDDASEALRQSLVGSAPLNATVYHSEALPEPPSKRVDKKVAGN